MNDRYSPRNMMIFDGDHSMPTVEVARRLNAMQGVCDRLDALILKLEANGIGLGMQKSLKEVRGE
jgi:hypothetical protein